MFCKINFVSCFSCEILLFLYSAFSGIDFCERANKRDFISWAIHKRNNATRARAYVHVRKYMCKNVFAWQLSTWNYLSERAYTLASPMRNLQIRVSRPDGNFQMIIKMSAQTTPYHCLTTSAITMNAWSMFSWTFYRVEKQMRGIYMWHDFYHAIRYIMWKMYARKRFIL